jgi:predicted unusual protein kinase regulating ubiquinone biosynthesis (AarF/ABC1/UbiB family)
MTPMFWVVLGGSLAALAVVVVWRRTSSLPAGRLRRLLRLGRLTARLSTSAVGAKVRRLFAGPERRARLDEAQRQANARAVAETMGQMKGAIMKLGQMLSFVSDDVPAEYRAALQSLQTAAPPMEFPLLRDVAERELGKPLERAFARFDETPLAAASIGQVHRATLPDGREVVVKIQYPGVAEAIRGDLANVAVLYRMIGMFYPALDPAPVVDELRARLSEELDYVLEAKNQRAFVELYDGHPFIRVPKVIDAYSTARVLTSEFVSGRRLSDVQGASDERRQRYAEILYRFVFGSILHFGVFNGDPHPGNYLFDDEGRVVFLDFGCVKYFPDAMLMSWRSLVEAHLCGDRHSFRRQAVALGFLTEDAPIDADLLYDYFGQFYEPWSGDRSFTFDQVYHSKFIKVVFKPEGRFAGLQKRFNMPRDFVFVNRIQWGVYAILSSLDATANWYRIHRELLYGEPSSTDVGRLDQEYRARWRAARGLGSELIVLAPEGIRLRQLAS